METFRERLLALVAEYGKGKLKFAEKIGISSSKLSSYIKEEHSSLPSSDIIAQISLEFPQFNIVWLLTGQGEMYNSGFAPPKKSSDLSGETVEEIKATLDQVLKRLAMVEKALFSKQDIHFEVGKGRANQHIRMALAQR